MAMSFNPFISKAPGAVSSAGFVAANRDLQKQLSGLGTEVGAAFDASSTRNFNNEVAAARQAKGSALTAAELQGLQGKHDGALTKVGQDAYNTRLASARVQDATNAQNTRTDARNVILDARANKDLQLKAKQRLEDVAYKDKVFQGQEAQRGFVREQARKQEELAGSTLKSKLALSQLPTTNPGTEQFSDARIFKDAQNEELAKQFTGESDRAQKAQLDSGLYVQEKDGNIRKKTDAEVRLDYVNSLDDTAPAAKAPVPIRNLRVGLNGARHGFYSPSAQGNFLKRTAKSRKEREQKETLAGLTQRGRFLAQEKIDAEAALTATADGQKLPEAKDLSGFRSNYKTQVDRIEQANQVSLDKLQSGLLADDQFAEVQKYSEGISKPTNKTQAEEFKGIDDSVAAQIARIPANAPRRQQLVQGIQVAGLQAKEAVKAKQLSFEQGVILREQNRKEQHDINQSEYWQGMLKKIKGSRGKYGVAKTFQALSDSGVGGKQDLGDFLNFKERNKISDSDMAGFINATSYAWTDQGQLDDVKTAYDIWKLND